MIATIALIGVASANKTVFEAGCFRSVIARREPIWLVLGHPDRAKSALLQSRDWCGYVTDLQEVVSGSVGELIGDVQIHPAAEMKDAIASRVRTGSLKFSVRTIGDAWEDEFGFRHYVKVDQIPHVGLVEDPAFPTSLLRSA